MIPKARYDYYMTYDSNKYCISSKNVTFYNSDIYVYIYVMQMLAAHHLPIPRDWLCSESLVSLSCVCVCQRISALQELESLSLENSSLGE